MRSTSLAAVVVVALLGGCYPYGAYEYEVEYAPEGPVLEEEPPAPLVEEIPPPPFVGAVWVDGYWSWSGHRYLWVRGRYLRAPRPGVVWFHGGYVRVAGGYVWVAGRWAPPSYRMRYSYIYGPRWHRHGWYRRYHRGRYYRGGHYRGYHRMPRGYHRQGLRQGQGRYRGPGRKGRRYRGRAAPGPRGPHRARPSGGGGRRKHRAPRAP